MRYHDGLPAAGPRPYGTHGTYGIYGIHDNNAAYPGNLAERGLLAPVLFASAMSLGANMAAVRAQAMTPGRAVLDALAKGSVAALIAGAGAYSSDGKGGGSILLSRASTLALLIGAGYVIGAITGDAAPEGCAKASIQACTQAGARP